MRKAKAILGLPVIVTENGKQLGTVKDILLRKDWTVHSICIDQKRWFSPGKFIGCANIAQIGKDAVTVPHADVVTDTCAEGEAFSFVEGEPNLIRRRVLTRDGEELGALADVYIPAEMGKPIVGIEISEGLLGDLHEGRKWLPMDEPYVLGEDAVIVPDESREQLSAITF